MILRLQVLALLVISFTLVAQAQSLGEVAREARAEKQQSGASHAKVITNDDLEAHPQTEAPAVTEQDPSAKDESAKDAAASEAVAKGDGAKPVADATKQEPEAKADSAKEKHVEKKKDPEKEREERQLDTQKRSDEINKRYLDRISSLHEQINTAQLQLTKLETQKIESTNEFKRSAAMSPTYAEYGTQQREFDERIQAQRILISNLNSQLDDAREAARHAGVPHALDY